MANPHPTPPKEHQRLRMGKTPPLRLLPEHNASMPLVWCEPYGCRLSTSSCATRWARAQDKHKDTRVARCRDCEVGEQRAGVE